MMLKFNETKLIY